MANRDDERHPSRQLAARLRAEIEQGETTGKLRPYRELAELHGMARNTVQAAVRLLEAEGLVEIRGTAGVYVREPAAREVSQEEALRAELTAVRKKLEDTRQALADTEAAVVSLLKKLPAASRTE